MSKFNYRRRVIGGLLCLSPAVLCVLSYFAGPLVSWKNSWGVILVGLSVPIVFVNLIIILRPTCYKRIYGPKVEMRNVSGIPLIGNFFVLMSILVSFGDSGTALFGLVMVLLDVGGLPWLLVGTWQDRSFWDD